MEEMRLGEDVSEVLDEFNLPKKSSWHSPNSDLHLWVFSSLDSEQCLSTASSSICNNWVIQNKIRASLCAFRALRSNDSMLVQFWAPTMSGGCRILTTSHQPFALKNLKNANLFWYRKHCLSYNFVVDVNAEAGGDPLIDGLPGRVFRNQLPELSPDMSCYSVQEYPQRDLALSCGIAQSVALPVFESSQRCCVGVLELLLTTSSSYYLNAYVCRANDALKEAGLETIYTNPIHKQIRGGLGLVEEEIKEALKQVCKIHHLPVACAWFVLAHSVLGYGGSLDRGYNDSSVNCMGDLVVSIPDMWIYDSAISFENFNASWFLPLRVGQGLVGNAFLSNKPCLCRDVTQLGITEYPMAHFARKLGLTGCLAICLRSVSPRIHDYVLEFFLPPGNLNSEDLHIFLSSLLVILRRHLKSSENLTVGLGNESFIEVDKLSINTVFESFKTCRTISAQLEPVALQKKGDLMRVGLPDQQLFVQHFLKNGGDPGSLERGDIDPEKKSKVENQKNGSSCSYKILEQHFGRRLEDAAQSLGVSRSTFKRWCRDNNISRWPFPKRCKLGFSPPVPKQMDERTNCQDSVEQLSGASSRDPSCSHPPTNYASVPTTSTLTVKAVYMNDMIKFKLPSSSGVIDLVEKMTLRLKLSEGTFRIKYLDDDGDYVLITCDEDFQDCMNSLRLLEKTTIKLLIEPIANHYI